MTLRQICDISDQLWAIRDTVVTQQKRDINPMLVKCWASVCTKNARNKMKWMGFQATFVHVYRLNWDRRISRGWWDEWDETACSSDTWFEMRAQAAWGWVRYLSVTEAPHNIESLRVNAEENFVSLKLKGQSGTRTRYLRYSNQTDLTC